MHYVMTLDWFCVTITFSGDIKGPLCRISIIYISFFYRIHKYVFIGLELPVTRKHCVFVSLE